MKRIQFALSLALLLLSCAEEPDKKKKEVDESLTFSAEVIEKSLDDCRPEEGDCTFISLNFPKAEGEGPAAEKINKNIQIFLNQTIDYQEEGGIKQPGKLAEDFINNYKETSKEFSEYELPWEASIIGKIIYNGNELACLQFQTDMFTGGAHGYRSTNYLSFDPISGKRLSAEELFTEAFKAFAEKDFRKQQDIPEDANINSTGLFFENDRFKLPSNIGITADKVILFYNAYEIAPYAEGNYVLTYSRAELKEYLKIGKENH